VIARAQDAAGILMLKRIGGSRTLTEFCIGPSATSLAGKIGKCCEFGKHAGLPVSDKTDQRSVRLDRTSARRVRLARTRCFRDDGKIARDGFAIGPVHLIRPDLVADWFAQWLRRTQRRARQSALPTLAATPVIVPVADSPAITRPARDFGLTLSDR
jgi:hypothetical protein